MASFVHPMRVPQMADAEAVCAGLPTADGVTYIGLVMNMRGAERAIAAGVHEIGAVACSSDGVRRGEPGPQLRPRRSRMPSP